MEPNPIAVTFSELYTVAAFFIHLLLLKLTLLSRPAATRTTTTTTTTTGAHRSRVQSIEDTCPSAGWAAGPTEEEEECAVCLSEFVRGEAVRELGCCRHTFHKGCVDKWLFAAGKVTCPLCRSNVVAAEEDDVMMRPPPAGVLDDDDDDDWGSQQFALLLLKLRGGNVT